MKRLYTYFVIITLFASCGTMRTAQNAPVNSLAPSVSPQDTVTKADPLKKGSVKDSSLQSNTSTDSSLRSSTFQDSLKLGSLKDSALNAIALKDSTVLSDVDSSSVTVQEVQEPVRYDFSPVYQTDVYVPIPQEMPAGEYSGITYLGSHNYAVVHDKLNGGGIVFMQIYIDDSGKVNSVETTIPVFTTSSKVSGRDNEGIAFVPDAKNTPHVTSGRLFVSSESTQSIVEYTLDGKETGRSLKVPAAFAKDKINSNNGFEALTYNDVTQTFWTTTETPLKADGKDSRLLRLQSFDSNLKAGKQYLYKMDAPVKSADEGAAAKAYVHGVPAMAALDDGSLIVLEREVYVPNGGLFAKALGSFTRTKLYVVNPSGSSSKESSKKSSSEILEKRLLLSFNTSALNLANYEGMCVGPVIYGENPQDDWHTLVLIADSQGGSNGLTAEYIKVIVFK